MRELQAELRISPISPYVSPYISQVRELQAELRAKQAAVEEMSGSAKNARFKELEVQGDMGR